MHVAYFELLNWKFVEDKDFPSYSLNPYNAYFDITFHNGYVIFVLKSYLD